MLRTVLGMKPKEGEGAYWKMVRFPLETPVSCFTTTSATRNGFRRHCRSQSHVTTWSLPDWLTDWLAGWLAGRPTDWLADWLTSWLAGWLTDWLTDWLTCWLADWLAESDGFNVPFFGINYMCLFPWVLCMVVYEYLWKSVEDHFNTLPKDLAGFVTSWAIFLATNWLSSYLAGCLVV